jgi:hypothetical protein
MTRHVGSGSVSGSALKPIRIHNTVCLLACAVGYLVRICLENGILNYLSSSFAGQFSRAAGVHSQLAGRQNIQSSGLWSLLIIQTPVNKEAVLCTPTFQLRYWSGIKRNLKMTMSGSGWGH